MGRKEIEVNIRRKWMNLKWNENKTQRGECVYIFLSFIKIIITRCELQRFSQLLRLYSFFPFSFYNASFLGFKYILHAFLEVFWECGNLGRAIYACTHTIVCVCVWPCEINEYIITRVTWDGGMRKSGK